MEEFERFTRNFRTFYYIKNRFWYPFFRPNVSLNERLINMVGASSADRMSQRLDRQAARGRLKIGLVPGFGRYNYS
jgi:hypothetical protein